MNLSLFISKKIVKADRGSFSSIVNKIAIASIALGLAIMLISFLILGGFETTIREKIYGFSGHINITKYTMSNSYEEAAMEDKAENRKSLLSHENVAHIQAFAHKPGLLKTDKEVQGVLLKGVSKDFNLKVFKENIREGAFIEFKDDGASNDIVISQTISDQLNLKVGDDVIMFFIQNPVRYRKFDIKGIFETSMEEFDKQVIIGDLAVIQKLNGWKEGQVGGYELFLSDLETIDKDMEELADELTYEFYLQKVSDKYLQIFDWLTLLNQNVNIFLGLILLVACVNMVAILLILIMERTNMIGVLKALGATGQQIRGIFFYNGFLLVLKGILLGNIVGLGLGFVQDRFRLIALDPENYYMKYVPILWDWPVIIFLNVLVLGVISLVLIIPTFLVTKISPVKAIKFD
ncbi:MAG TPA: FtsX-like permease family protein [Cytophagales bacterium]|nr:FtsX-like permease family protein [Cytophagales bacterium]